MPDESIPGFSLSDTILSYFCLSDFQAVIICLENPAITLSFITGEDLSDNRKTLLDFPAGRNNAGTVETV